MKKNHVITWLCFVAAIMISARPAPHKPVNKKQWSNAGLLKKDFNHPDEFYFADGANLKNPYHLQHILHTFSPPDNDAAIGNIIDPNGEPVCNEVITPKITIQNLGSDVLTSVEVGMLLDGLPLGTITTINNLSLATSATSDIIVLTPDFAPAAGVHELKVYTRNPNGSPDASTGNDTTSVSFTVTPTLSLTYKESFESEIFPPANGSDTINGDDGSVTWERTTNAASAGDASIYLNGFNYQEKGQKDIYRTPKINVSALDSVVVFFSVAYKQYEGAADSLSIVYSPDCGVTWLATGYSKGGASLSTSPGYATDEFFPDPSEWRVERVTLKDFCSGNLQSIMIGFQSYNDYGNDIYVDAINIAGFASSARNAVLTSVDQPSITLCTTGFSPAISFSNAGLDTLHSVKINYQVDGGAVTSFDWTGSLTRCGTATVTLPGATSTEGAHILTVFTSSPNGLNDFATANDTLRKGFTIYNTTPLQPPVTQGFETTDIPNWGIQNFDGLKTWEHTTAAAKTGVASLWINNPAADNASSAVDNLISPVIENAATNDSMFVSFDYAYKSGGHYPGSTVLPLDTLEVLITKDCGATFTSVWKKWGEELQTVGDPNYSSSEAFTPAPGEWKSAGVYISPVLGTGNFQVYFSSKSNKQNNIWLDNINITAKTLPSRLKSQGYLIYPNPFSGSFLVHHVSPPVDLKSIQVYNSIGQLVWDNRYNGNANTEININLGNNSRGVYIIKIIYADRTVVERVVKD